MQISLGEIIHSIESAIIIILVSRFSIFIGNIKTYLLLFI